jgi:hypothetical protein
MRFHAGQPRLRPADVPDGSEAATGGMAANLTNYLD